MLKNKNKNLLRLSRAKGKQTLKKINSIWHAVKSSRQKQGVIFVLAFAVIGTAYVATSRAANPGDPIFFTVCNLSHRASDDPIVHPGKPGDSHNHQFTGAWSTDAFSTVDSLRRSGTTCDMLKDTASYWSPTVYKNGKPLELSTFAYYVYGNHEVDRSQIKAHPAGLKMVADMSAGYGSGWHCGNAKPPPGGVLSQTTVPNCSTTKGLQAKVVFPNCWDGKNLDSPDHRSHMAYAQRSEAEVRIGCPASHPVPVPTLNLKTRFLEDTDGDGQVDDAAGGTGITISSGAPSTFHADFFNTWDQAELERLVRECLNKSFPSGGETCRGTGKTLKNPSYPNAHPPEGASVPAPAPKPAPKPVPAKQGDINGDGKVNISDLSTLLSKFNTKDPNSDINKDNKVDVFDLSILLSRYDK